MIEPLEILPGVRLRCVQTDRFKSSCMSISLLRPLCREEAAKNALLSNVLMQGSAQYPDMQSLSLALDELYGASLGPLCRKNGEIQTMGFYMSCLEDRYALEGDRILEPAVEVMVGTLLEPALEDGVFRADYVELEKENLVNTIQSSINDKKVYASQQMLRALCRDDVFSVPRLGEPEDVMAITPDSLYRHYKTILATSQIEIFYAGSRSPLEIQALMGRALSRLPREQLRELHFAPLPRHEGVQYLEETMEVTQGKLAMGFTLGKATRDMNYPACMLFNALFGGDMTSKLFMNVREKLSLCYYASSALISPKGILTVACGIDTANYERAKDEILHQLELCREGQITEQELDAAKKALTSSLKALGDSLGAMEDYSAFQVLTGLELNPPEYLQALKTVTAEDVAQVARQVQLDTIFFLKGVSQ